MSQEISDFIHCSHEIARRGPCWVAGPGGNVSWKDSKRILIKASGSRLDQVSTDRGLMWLDLPPTLEALKKALSASDSATQENLYQDLLKNLAQGPVRPSMEMGFHVLLTPRWIVHFHALSAFLMLDALQKNPSSLKEILTADPDLKNLKLSALNYTPPGFELAKELLKAPAADIYLLKNHGVVLTAESSDVLELWEKFEKSFLKKYYPEALSVWGGDWQKLFSQGYDQGPMKALFPDFVVYQDEIQKNLTSTDVEKFRFDSTATGDVKLQNLRELWASTQVLTHFLPAAEEIQSRSREQLHSMPSEIFRRGQK